MSWWIVRKALSHGGMIHGARRKIDDVFEAPDTAMTFQAAEGVVEKTDAPKAQPAPVAPAAKTDVKSDVKTDGKAA